MAAIAGKGGSAKVGANTIASINNWSLDVTMNTAETTALGDSVKSHIATIYEWSGQLEGAFRVHDDTNGQTALQTAFLAGTPVTLNLYVNASNYYSGSAIITSMPVKVAVEDKVGISFAFQGSGALTYN
jgi:predicted secreted protein